MNSLWRIEQLLNQRLQDRAKLEAEIRIARGMLKLATGGYESFRRENNAWSQKVKESMSDLERLADEDD